MEPGPLLARVRAELAAASDEEFRRGVANFFREQVNPYGVRSPAVKRIVQRAAPELEPWPAGRRMRFAEHLLASGRLEEGAAAIHLCRRFSMPYAAPEFATLERWIDRFTGNWATCDGIASWLLSACIATDPSLIAALPVWTRSPNRWKRRAAAVALLQEARRGRHTAAIFRIAALLVNDPDDMVRKGVGWLLKETYPSRPREVMRFLKPLAAAAPRLVLRIAAEKMAPADRISLADASRR